MTDMTTKAAIIAGYIAIAVLTATVLFGAARRVRRPDTGHPSEHCALICAAGGALWPLLLLGGVELAAVSVARRLVGNPPAQARICHSPALKSLQRCAIEDRVRRI